MNCPDSTLLMRWLDGELSREEAVEVEKHLESCAECLSLVETQRKMESAWRESWTDPAPAAFETLRRNLSARSHPWWRRQRSWMAVAAVFAVYLGVKIFLIDGAGRPMAEVASESPPPAPRTEFFAEPEVTPGVADDSADEALVEQEILEVEQQEEVMAPAEEQQEEAEEEDAPASMEEAVDAAAGFTASRSLSFVESSDSTVEMCFGAGGGGLVSGATGEGIGASSYGIQQAEAPEAGRDDYANQTVASCAPVAGIQVTAELQGGETVTLYRDVWPEVFLILDIIFESGEYTPGEPVSISVDHSGLVSGPLVPEGTIIALPDSTYGNCSVTALPF